MNMKVFQMAAWQRLESSDVNQFQIDIPLSASKTTFAVPYALEKLHDVALNLLRVNLRLLLEFMNFPGMMLRNLEKIQVFTNIANITFPFPS
jgi:hypothetical protein